MDPIQITSHVNGRDTANGTRINTIRAYDTTEMLQVRTASPWILESALETCSRVQPQLDRIPLERIIELVEHIPDFFFPTEDLYAPIIKISGGSKRFVLESMGFLNEWCRNIRAYVDKSLPTEEAACKSTAPVVAVLPSNSEMELLYVAAQILLSRNAAVIRPSSKGAGAYTAQQFILALNKAIDACADPVLEPVRRSIQIVHTSERNYLHQLAVDGWNYVFFGDDDSLRSITATIREQGAEPRKVVAFGTGLSTTFLFADCDLDRACQEIIQAITVNAGNECISTDILYVEQSIAGEVMQRLNSLAEQYQSGDPFDPGRNGLVLEHNARAIAAAFNQTGKTGQLQLTTQNSYTTLNPAILEVQRFETAMEYPGPVCSVRAFTDLDELTHLSRKDRRDNRKSKNLVTSIYTQSADTCQQCLRIA